MDEGSSPIQPPAWFWCIPLAERNILRATCALLVSSAQPGYPYSIYNTLWEFVALSREARESAFVEIYGLMVIDFTPDPDTSPVSYLFIKDAVFWVYLLACFATGSLNGEPGCDRWYPS